MLYFSFESNILEKQEKEIQNDISEINKRFEEGKLRMLYKPNMHPRVKEHMKKLMSRGR